MGSRPQIYDHSWRTNPNVPKGEKARHEWMDRNIYVTNYDASQCAHGRCSARPTVLVGHNTKSAVCDRHVGLRIRIARLDDHGRVTPT